MSETIELDEAVAQLTAAFRRRRERGGTASDAFFFVIGAGMSAPVVPLAGQIERSCRDEALGRGAKDALPSGSPGGSMDRYAHWLRTAHPQPTDRQEYFRELIERQPISAANLRLAHLLLSDLAPRLVVTPNFDDFLSRALTLFGRPHVVCDHPATAERIDPERANDIQILHVHGTYWFYDCVNLKGEIDARARSEPVHQTVGSRLDRILDRRSPIVLGYSGWDGDVLTMALRRRLAAGPLGYNLYWFCYSADALDAVPDFLRVRDDVYFVLPSETRQTGASSGDAKGAPQSAEAPATQGSTRPRLEAVTVLEALIRSLEIDAPGLTQNPIEFFASHLRGSLLVAQATDTRAGVADLYGLQPMIERLEAMRTHWDSDLEPQGDEPRPDAQLERVRDAIRRSQYREAVREAVQIPLDGLEAAELEELSRSAWLAAVRLLDDSEDERAGYRLSVDAADALARDDPPRAEELAGQAAKALVYEAITLNALGDSARALEVCDEVVARYGGDLAPTLREQVAMALFNKGVWLGVLGRLEEEIASYEQVVDRYGDDPEPTLREQVAMALVNKGVRLGVLGRVEEEIASYEQVVDRYGDDPEPTLREQVAKALYNKGIWLGALGRGEEEIASYEQVVDRYGDDLEPTVRVQVAMALFNKGVRLGVLDRGEEEIASYEQVVDRYGDDPEPTLREQVAMALVNKGVQLGELDRSEEAIASYEQVVDRYGDDPELTLREQVAKALVNKGVQLGELDRSEEAIASYEQVVDRYGDDPEPTLREQAAKALLNKGTELSARGERQKALEVYEDAMEHFADDSALGVRAVRDDIQRELDGLLHADATTTPEDSNDHVDP